METTYNFEALITLLPTERGGRKSAISNNFRPNFSFNTKKMYCGEIRTENNKSIAPGQNAVVTIHLLPATTIPTNLTIFKTFIISEGKKVIGNGQITSLQKTEIINNDELIPA